MEGFKVSVFTNDDRKVLLEDLDRETLFQAELPKTNAGDVEFSVLKAGEVVHSFRTPINEIKQPILPIRLVEQIEKHYYDA